MVLFAPIAFCTLVNFQSKTLLSKFTLNPPPFNSSYDSFTQFQQKICKDLMFKTFRATSAHNGTFQCLSGASDFYRFHVFVMGTPQPEVGGRPRINRPVVSGMMMNYGTSITIPCSAEG